MHKLLYIITLLSLNMYGQAKYITKTGSVGFEASVPSFEAVKANNNAVTAIINTDNGEFASLVLVKGFRFKNALMEEHFNENYAESDTYPKATFKGKIKDFKYSELSNQNRIFKMEGELNFHGKTKELNALEILISKENNTINISGNFKTNTSDFNIKIPKIVRNKIAEDITITYKFNLKQK